MYEYYYIMHITLGHKTLNLFSFPYNQNKQDHWIQEKNIKSSSNPINNLLPFFLSLLFGVEQESRHKDLVSNWSRQSLYAPHVFTKLLLLFSPFFSFRQFCALFRHRLVQRTCFSFLFSFSLLLSLIDWFFLFLFFFFCFLYLLFFIFVFFFAFLFWWTPPSKESIIFG